MTTPQVDVDAKAARAALRELKKVNIERLLGPGAKIIRGAAHPPIDTGRLDGSPTIKFLTTSANVTWEPYGAYIQWGTKYIDADPFVTEAINSEETRIMDSIADEYQTKIKQSGLT